MQVHEKCVGMLVYTHVQHIIYNGTAYNQHWQQQQQKIAGPVSLANGSRKTVQSFLVLHGFFSHFDFERFFLLNKCGKSKCLKSKV